MWLSQQAEWPVRVLMFEYLHRPRVRVYGKLHNQYHSKGEFGLDEWITCGVTRVGALEVKQI